uniref:Uncharacterized protein n=1 Tax=Arundo donax TaxID=35708 RepID=A0A0A9RLP9_ARUDO
MLRSIIIVPNAHLIWYQVKNLASLFMEFANCILLAYPYKGSLSF